MAIPALGTSCRRRVAVDPSMTLPVPSLLFHIDGAEPNLTDYRDAARWFDYDVTHDGQRFLIRQPLSGAEPRADLQVIIGWLPVFSAISAAISVRARQTIVISMTRRQGAPPRGLPELVSLLNPAQ